YLVRPIEHGADIVLHSATKFLGGHGTTLGGVVVESGRFDWGNGNFPGMTEPVASYGGIRWWDNFGEYGFLTKLRSEQLRDIGPSLPAQSAFQLLQGVETLPQRIDAHLAGARAVAEWLDADPRVSGMTEPVASYGGIRWWDNFGEYGFLTKLRSEQLRDIGPSLPAQSAFQLLQGVETLPQRIDAHLAGARAVAEWLDADPRVSFVT